MNRHTYALLGASILTIGGTTLFVSLVLVASESGAVVAIAILVLGLVLVSLGQTKSVVPPSLALILAKSGYDNTARLIEELGVHSRAVYLPSGLCEGVPLAAIPIAEHATLMRLKRPVESRLIARLGQGEMALLITTPGSFSLEMLDAPVGHTLDEAASALTTIVSGSLGLATAVSISDKGDQLHVRLENCLQPALLQNGSLEMCLGSPPASITATVLAESLERPVGFEFEKKEGAHLLVVLRQEEEVGT
ncbi:MAG: hypothetical protein ACOC9B_04330 [Chloroflexota bacterium]